jgi:hypothetical protein
MTEADTHRYAPAPRVLTQDVHGEIVVLDLDSQRYFGLNEVGARTWRLLEAGQSLDDVIESLEAEFDVSPEQLESDLQRLIADLLSAGLLKPA